MRILFLLMVLAAGIEAVMAAGAETASPALLAQLKPHELGNCFQWTGCRGDSIGMQWVHAPEFCGAMAGKSWMDQSGQCHDLPEGPWRTQPPPPAPPQRPSVSGRAAR